MIKLRMENAILACTTPHARFRLDKPVLSLHSWLTAERLFAVSPPAAIQRTSRTPTFEDVEVRLADELNTNDVTR